MYIKIIKLTFFPAFFLFNKYPQCRPIGRKTIEKNPAIKINQHKQRKEL